MNKRLINIVLLGAPGCGKGTQAAFIKEKYDLEHVSTGALYREEMASGSAIGIEAKRHIDNGHLCPDEMTLDILSHHIQSHDEVKGFILDGVPRTIQQANMMEGKGYDHIIPVDLVINLEIPEEIITERLEKRSKELNRTDDTPEVIRQRIIHYNNLTKPLVAYYEERNILKNVNGAQTLENVFKDICAVIDAELERLAK